MEIYTNSSERTAYLDVPVNPTGSAIEVTVLDGSVVVHTPSTVSFEDGRLSFVLPFAFTQSDKKYVIRWKFPYTEDGQNYEYDNTNELDVVTPILPINDIKYILNEEGEDEYTLPEMAIVEKAVRYIVQAHTGQSFGKFIGKKSVTGSGDNFLRLPMKLISLASINDSPYWNEALAVRGSGWYLQSKTFGVPPIRADFDGWHEDPYSGSVPIVAPRHRALFSFADNHEYIIDGIWGWNSVPAAVKEAARLLINDYACGDNNYRDRFLTSMTAADWRIQFHDGAFSNTGNVRANQLLSEFVLRRGWVVI